MKKRFIKALSLVLSLITILGALPLTLLSFAESYSVGDSVFYGSYPKTKVSDSELISVLETKVDEAKWTKYDFYGGNGSDGSAALIDVASYQDIIYQGEKYRAVNIYGYRPNSVDSAPTSQNSGMDECNYQSGNTYFFRFEPIEWKILDPSTGLAVSLYILDAQPTFNQRYIESGSSYTDSSKGAYASNYAESYVREWLIGEFYETAFPGDSGNALAATSLETKGYAYGFIANSALDSGSVSDKVFLLSYEDVINADYGFNTSANGTVNLSEFKDRFAERTDYSKAMNAGGSSSGKWKLRNASASGNTYCVVTSGKINGESGTFADCGIRPAVCLDLDEVDKYYINCVSDGEIISRVSDKSDILSPEKTGYTFVGWDYTVTENPTDRDIWIEAQWSINTHTAYFDSGSGAFFNDQHVKQLDVNFGETPHCSAPEKTGYHFTGWSDGENFYEIAEFNVNYKMPDNDVYFTAVFAPDENTPYTVKEYRENLEGEYYLYSTETFYGTTDTMTAITPEPDIGFETDEEKTDSNKIIAADGSTVINIYYFRKTYTLTFDFNDGVNEKVTKQCKYGSPIDFPSIPSRPGYTAKGWNANPETVLGPGDYFIEWTHPKYTITFSTDGGTNIGSYSLYYGDAVTAPRQPEKRGYTFVGWDKEIPKTMPEENLVINAVWSANEYTITWISDGKQYYIQTGIIGDTVSVPAPPEKEGYTFKGWDKAIQQKFDAVSLTYTALFEKKEYNIKSKLGIKSPSTKTIKYHDVLVLSASASDIPDGAKIEWSISGSGIKKTETSDSLVCKFRAESKGTATVSVKLTLNGQVLKDSNGNEIADEITLTTDCGFFSKISSFFKDLFKSNREFT